MVPTWKHPRMHVLRCEWLMPGCIRAFRLIQCSFMQNSSGSALFHKLWWVWCTWIVPTLKHPRIHAFTCERLKPGCFGAFGLMKCSFTQNSSGSTLFHLLWWVWFTWMVPTWKHPRMQVLRCEWLKPGCIRAFRLIQCSFMQNSLGSAPYH